MPLHSKFGDTTSLIYAAKRSKKKQKKVKEPKRKPKYGEGTIGEQLTRARDTYHRNRKATKRSEKKLKHYNTGMEPNFGEKYEKQIKSGSAGL